ncbi:DUF3237 family protein [Aurantiacibacter gilvus]|uniref:UPF0311 protein AAEO60_09850 n=1 Tax=Aurantiacibacter gilvus TaxID=3139141 RepID=A0ABU9IFH2_9SPHN
MEEGHSFAPRMEHAFSISIDLSAPYWVEPTVRGETRAAIYAKSGKVEGPRLTGSVVPMSGGDFPLSRQNGVIDFDARYLIEASDGAIIYMENRGYRWAKDEDVAERMRNNEPVPFDDYYMRVTPKFDAPAGPHEWMSKHVFVGVAEKVPGANRIHYFVVL